ncbi:hybrid sensor histidine kinase/response regulator transcription factor [Spirosoma gilvum]
MITILVVDDEVDLEPLLRGRFRQQIQQKMYTFLFAQNGRQGLTIIREQPAIDLILLDIQMPEMDGLALLNELAALNVLIGTVMVSAYGDMNNIRTAMNRGAFDFVTKPIDFADLSLTIEKTARYVQQLRESQQLKVISELKTRFFDNITHEFRTPLTLILSPVEQLLQHPPEPQDLRTSLLMVERNAQQLLRLINQLLDLAKLEAGYLPLSPKAGDLTAFVGQIVQTFKPLADSRQVELDYQSDLAGFYVFDSEKLEQIIFNLLMNALKFTAAGQVTVQVTQRATIQISVSDTGIGIAPEKLPYIFNRFYQVIPSGHRQFIKTDEVPGFTTPGTGIGLALVKELTELMGGTVSVQSTVRHAAGEKSGTLFTISLPFLAVSGTPPIDSDAKPVLQPLEWLSQPATTPSNQPSGSVGTELTRSSDSEKALVLVVEDNPELCAFIAKELSRAYRILTADNGEAGWKLAKAELPDIVLTDVMMPGIDGYELTHRLKSDLTTDHIAVVILSAKTAHPSRIEGLQQGADDYISKPFHVDELNLRLQNLLTRQQTLRAHYQQVLSQPGNLSPTEVVLDKFLQKLQALLEKHLDDSQFGVNELAYEVGMSRRTLARKLMAITNLSINDFMRQFRLLRATQFLQEGHNVSETAYMVGYESPAYFAIVFKEFFQKTPSEFMRR